MKMPAEHQAVTVSLPKDRDDYERAKRRALDHMQNASSLGTKGRITWTRDSLHERR